MASLPDTGRSGDGERPTLPPIRDLFHDLRTPHDSPSLTLARLRVGDDYDSPSHTRPSSSLSFNEPSRSQTPRLGQADFHQAYQYTRPPPSKPHHSAPEPRSFELSSFAYPPEPHHPTTRHSLPYAQEPSGLGSLGSYTRRHASLSAPSCSSIYTPDANAFLDDDRTPVARHNPRIYDVPSGKHLPRYSAWPVIIPIVGPSMVDDERTPVARRDGYAPPPANTSEENHNGALSKYECSYCGKGFNRPSSLKIHLNSHTGAKPFVCPVESCGRSFSVLSNMRRHARVHTQTPLYTDPSSDEDSERSSSFTGSPSATLSHTRRGSTASVSSSGSRRSHASDDDSAQEASRPDKRFRVGPK